MTQLDLIGRALTKQNALQAHRNEALDKQNKLLQTLIKVMAVDVYTAKTFDRQVSVQEILDSAGDLLDGFNFSKLS